MLKMNFNKTLIPIGLKVFEVMDAEQRQGKDSGDDYASLRCAVVSEEDKGRSTFLNISVQEKVLWRAQQVLRAMKMPCKGKISLDPAALIAKRFKATVSHVPVEGNDGELVEQLSDFQPAE